MDGSLPRSTSESSVPADKTAAVARALQETFGSDAITDIQPIPATLGSDLSFRIVARGSGYLLRLMPRIDERMDPRRIFSCLCAAADAGLAPRVWYAGAQDGISISDFVEPVSLSISHARLCLPATLRRLHALPLFPKEFNYLTAHNGFIWRLRSAGLLPKTDSDEVFGRYTQICAVYPRIPSDMVSCHGDVKRDNLLFDGQQVWLLGWHAAFVNDRYFDLAVAANYLAVGDSDESAWLEHYWEQPPDRYQQARFFLMRQVLNMLSAAVFLMLGSAETTDYDRSLPSFTDFHRQLWAGERNVFSADAKTRCGLVYWRELQRNLQQVRFSDAIEVVAARSKSSDNFGLLLPAAP